MTSTNIYNNGPWVLLDQHGAVVDIVDTPRLVGKFITEQVADGLGYEVDTLEHRCGECGEKTKLDDPHAPDCSVADGGDRLQTLGGLLDHLRKHLKVNDETDDAETANDSAEEIFNATKRLLDMLQPRQVDDTAIGVTLDGVDVQVRTEGNATTVSVGAEEAPDDRHVVVQDWSSVAWEQEIKTPS